MGRRQLISKFILLLGLFSLILTNLWIYKSHTEQIIMLSEFNQNNFGSKLEEVDKFNDFFPNLSVTALPLKSMKALYFLKAGDYEKAFDLLYGAIDDNPSIKFTEYNLGVAYNGLGVEDSARHYYKKAFYGLPGNLLHNSAYLKQVINDDNRNEIEKVFKMTSHIDHYINWYQYLSYHSNKMNKDSIYRQENFNRIDSLVGLSKELFGRNEFKQIEQVVLYGGDKVIKSNEIIEKAKENFDKGELILADSLYREAIKLVPNEFSNYENLALVLIDRELFQEAIDQLNLMEQMSNYDKDGKSNYLKGICYYKMGNNVKACLNFNISYNEFKNNDGGTLLRQICK